MSLLVPEETAKRLKRTQVSPETFVTWNCNGFTSRSLWDTDQLRKLLAETNEPDMICLQEARLKAYDQHQRGRPKESEYAKVQDAVEGVFKGYQPFWSLADNKYAGTLTLVHRRLDWDKSLVAFSPPEAIDVLLQKFKVTRQEAGLVVASSTVTSPSKAPKQTSMMSFFSPKKSPSSPAKPISSHKHHPEGRFQFFSFETMDVIQTYVPNNGTKDTTFEKREKWDKEMLRFLKNRREILRRAKQESRRLVWCGDLNVANEYLDGTHWQRRDDGTVIEWWTDESKCFVGGASSPAARPKRPENVGIPSFTPAERSRFQQMLLECDMVDVWRALHPKGVVDSKLSPWDRPDYTWRGHLGKNGNVAKYQGRGQRLDYFLLTPSSGISSVESCQILGYGEKREGLFCGSDHCASYLKLKNDNSS